MGLFSKSEPAQSDTHNNDNDIDIDIESEKDIDRQNRAQERKNRAQERKNKEFLAKFKCDWEMLKLNHETLTEWLSVYSEYLDLDQTAEEALDTYGANFVRWQIMGNLEHSSATLQKMVDIIK